jgi:tRNA threonylcarbamoyladenosine biosynthesis protein TsaE
MTFIMNQPLSLFLPDETATLGLGAALARGMTPGLVVYLDGDLGAGKTTLVRGLLRALGDAGPVKSPTYTLVELHAVSGLNLYHFDFYRFNQPDEYLDAGLDEYFSGEGVCLVEWPAQAAPYVPAADLEIRLSVLGSGRQASIATSSERGGRCLASAGLTSSAAPGAIFSGSLPPV